MSNRLVALGGARGALFPFAHIRARSARPRPQCSRAGTSGLAPFNRLLIPDRVHFPPIPAAFVSMFPIGKRRWMNETAPSVRGLRKLLVLSGRWFDDDD